MLISDVLATSRKMYVDGTVEMGRPHIVDFPRIPTGIFAVDYALGGGIPIGVTSSVYGPEAGGKTLLLSKAVAGAQNICWKCYEYLWDCKCKTPQKRKVVFVTTEMQDWYWVEDLGVNLDDLVRVEPDCGEQASDIIAECLRADDAGLVVLDSLAMLTPEVEITASASDDQVAQQARLISRMVRRIKTILIREKKRGHSITFFTANQIRSKIGGFMRGPTEEIPGGHTSKHDWHLMFRISQLKSDDISKETDLPNNAKFKISMAAMGNKRKVFTMAGTAEFYITVSNETELMRGTANDYRTALQYGRNIGAIAEDWSFMGKKYPTQTKLRESWFDNNTFLSAKKFIIDRYIEQTKEDD